MLKAYRARLRNGVLEPVDPLPQDDCEAIVTLEVDDPLTAEERERAREAAIKKFKSLAGCCRSGDPKLSEKIDAVLYGKQP